MDQVVEVLERLAVDSQFRKDFEASNPIIDKLVKISGAKQD